MKKNKENFKIMDEKWNHALPKKILIYLKKKKKKKTYEPKIR